MEIQTRDLSKARRQLEIRGRVSDGSLPPDIADSWHRCVRLGLDPLANIQATNLDASALREARDAHESLIRFARPEIELLHDQIAGSNFMIALGSPDGTILQTLVDNQFSDNPVAHTVVPGSLWSESVRGTNALGIALKTGRPAHVYGPEHYLKANGNVSCICAPIFNGRGQIAGLLDASTTARPRQEHTAALLQMSAGNIENGLIRSQYEDHLVLLFHPRPEYLDTLSVGVLVLDDAFRIVAFNRRGGIFLAGLTELVGTPFSAIFEDNLEALASQLGRGETVRVRDRFGSAASMRCLPNRASFALCGARVTSTNGDAAGPIGARFQSERVFEDDRLQEALAGLPNAVEHRMPISLEGENGTGKSTLATLIQEMGDRNGCGASLQTGRLQQADLMGAGDQLGGLLAQAAGGTLFIELEEALPEAVQTVLIELLDHGAVTLPETQRRVDVDVLIVTVSQSGLDELAQRGILRSELAYRLQGFRVSLPPLRQRDDLDELVIHFLEDVRPDLGIEAQVLEAIAEQPWPGNLHELRSVVQSAAMRASGPRLTLADCPELSASPSPQGETAARIAKALLELTENGLKWKDVHGHTIRLMVERCDGNVAAAARLLGLSRTTIYKHLQ